MQRVSERVEIVGSTSNFYNRRIFTNLLFIVFFSAEHYIMLGCLISNSKIQILRVDKDHSNGYQRKVVVCSFVGRTSTEFARLLSHCYTSLHWTLQTECS